MLRIFTNAEYRNQNLRRLIKEYGLFSLDVLVRGRLIIFGVVPFILG